MSSWKENSSNSDVTYMYVCMFPYFDEKRSPEVWFFAWYYVLISVSGLCNLSCALLKRLSFNTTRYIKSKHLLFIICSWLFSTIQYHIYEISFELCSNRSYLSCTFGTAFFHKDVYLTGELVNVINHSNTTSDYCKSSCSQKKYKLLSCPHLLKWSYTAGQKMEISMSYCAKLALSITLSLQRLKK